MGFKRGERLCGLRIAKRTERQIKILNNCLQAGGNEHDVTVPTGRSSSKSCPPGDREDGGVGGHWLSAYRFLCQQPVLHDVLTGARHVRSCADVQAFIFQISGLYVLGKLFIRRH